jgi:hypothetical protein
MSDPSHASQDPLAHLIHVAGRREAPPAQAYERALAAATQSWQTTLRRRRWRTAARLAAGIAALAIGLGVALYSLKSQHALAQPVAKVTRVIGDVRVRPADSSDWISLRDDAGPMLTGAILRTETASAAALQLDEMSVRVADGAEVVLESKSRLRLVRGKVYVDTGMGGLAGRILIVTDAASVSDVGTQFEVQYQQGGYHVRVREGEVLLQHGSQRERGVAGEQISIDSGGTVRIAPFARDDPAWHWIHALASAPDIDNQPLTMLLGWVARETGFAIRYASPAVERKATHTILHGSIRHLDPLQALTVMMATTDLQHEVLSDGTIMIK